MMFVWRGRSGMWSMISNTMPPRMSAVEIRAIERKNTSVIR